MYSVKHVHDKTVDKSVLKLCCPNMSIENEKFTPKTRRKNKFSRALRQLFGCALKNVERTQSVSVSCQCQIEKDLEAVNHIGDDISVTENRNSLDNCESPASSLSQDFKSSLKKLDSLINTLNNIHDVYKTSTSMQCYHQETSLDRENFGEYEEDVLKFNINFEKNAIIECQSRKGKRSLQIVHNSGGQNFSPLILHRCESDFVIQRTSCETLSSLSTNTSSEVFLDKIDQLQRGYHTISGKFGPICAYDFTSFKKNLMDHMNNIKNEVSTLKGILCHVEYLTRDQSLPTLSFGDMRRWMFGYSDVDICTRGEDETMTVQRYRYLEARTRATNFCRFYMMERKQKKKIKSKSVSKTKMK